MNVFVLGTGRTGSVTYVKACEHMTNYTTSHETNKGFVGAKRLAYPDDHIEVDNRLSWFLGRLDEAYGDEAYYVHLKRDQEAVARSYLGRFHPGGNSIMYSYAFGVLIGNPDNASALEVCRDYCVTVTANINAFLKDKTHVMDFELENAKADFARFWEWVGAEGDFEAGSAEWERSYNATKRKE